MAAYLLPRPTHVTCRLTAKNRDQLRNPTLGNRVWATFTFFSATTDPTVDSTCDCRHFRRTTDWLTDSTDFKNRDQLGNLTLRTTMEYGLPLPFTFSATVHVERNGLSWTDLKIVDPDTTSVNWSCAQSGALTYEYFVLIGCSRSELGRIVCELQFVRAIWTFH